MISKRKILLVEDDLIEAMKLNRTITKLNFPHEVVQVKNGEEALAMLKDTSVSLPDVLLLDLNMPRMSGIEFLHILRADEELKYLPTIILTTSGNRADLEECFRIGVAGYIVKPLKYEDYQEKLRRVIEYWEVNELVKPIQRLQSSEI